MNTFVNFVASREHERVTIGPPRNDIPPTRCLVLNTWAVYSWAARQKISFAEWHANLDGWVVYGKDIPEEWSKQNRTVEAPELEIEERKTPSNRAKNETPLAGSVSRRTRSKKEHDVGSSKKDKSKSLMIVLHDSPVRDTSLTLSTPAIQAVGPQLVSTIEIAPFLSPDFEARIYRRKTIAHRVKDIRPDVESSSEEVNS